MGFELIVKKYRTTSSLLRILNGLVIDLAVPPNLTFFWNFGSLLGLILGSQILSGVFLAMHYSPDSALAFSSISHILRDVSFGWFLRSLHAIGASLFFAAMYLHVGRGMYFGSYISSFTWLVGTLLLVLVMAAAFLGYVLPWGQISFWGATVITNLFSSIPYIGSSLVFWLWGGFAVDAPTLSRFYALHFLLPFLISFFRGLHIFSLHLRGSNNPLGVSTRSDILCFHWYYSIKDVFGFMVVLTVAMFLIFFYPSLLLESVNFVPANPLITPPHILPE